MVRNLLAIFGMAAILGACATGTTDISMAMNDDIAKAGLLSEAPATVVTITATDAREDEKRDRIGDKRNGYGMVMGKIGTTEPVESVVQRVVNETFSANGHTVSKSADEGGLSIETEVTNFWFDYKTGLVTVEFFGDIQVLLKVIDPATETVIYEEKFKGYHSEKTGGGLSKTWTKVMDAALQDLSREIGMSMGLMEALDSFSAPAPEVVQQEEPQAEQPVS